MEVYKTILIAITGITLFLLICSLSSSKDRWTTFALILVYIAYLVYFILN